MAKKYAKVQQKSDTTKFFDRKMQQKSAFVEKCTLLEYLNDLMRHFQVRVPYLFTRAPCAL